MSEFILALTIIYTLYNGIPVLLVASHNDGFVSAINVHKDSMNSAQITKMVSISVDPTRSAI